MSLLVVGSVAFDSVETPSGKMDNALGGSATFFSTSASHFTQVHLVAVVGEDFPPDTLDFLKDRGVDISGLERREGKTFRWAGKYEGDLNEAQTLATELNVFETFSPNLPQHFRDSEYVFLANIDPDLQYDVLTQVKAPKLVACDTMNYWIDGKLDSLKKILSKVDVLLINDTEAKTLAGERNIVAAARVIREMGPRILVIKRGEYGALLFSGDEVFHAPALPMEEVVDPTGAGDTFAGGFMGYLAKAGSTSMETMRKATIMGSVMASYCVEQFSMKGTQKLNQDDIKARYEKFEALTRFCMFDD